jgi:uncharacterized protein YbjT (DUF2867 family)
MVSSPRTLFIAGATGAVGRTVVRWATARGADFVPHVRPKTAAQGKAMHPRAAVLELADRAALVDALRDRTTVLQLIGTMRSRFTRGDTYEISDIGTTRQLVEAAKQSGSIDHLILLSSVGAGRPFGAYLRAKARAEAIVLESGIPFTVFRPSAFMGEGHRVPGVFKTVTRAIGAKSWEPIAVDDLAAALLSVAEGREPLNTTLEGAALWELVASSAVTGRG